MNKIVLSTLGLIVLSGCGQKIECADPAVASTTLSIFSESPSAKLIGLNSSNFSISEIVTKSTAEDKKNATCNAKIKISLGGDLIGLIEKFKSNDEYAVNVIEMSPTLSKIEADQMKSAGIEKPQVNGIQALQMAFGQRNYEYEMGQKLVAGFRGGMLKGIRSALAETDSATSSVVAMVDYTGAVIEDKNADGKFKVTTTDQTIKTTLTLAGYIKEADSQIRLREEVLQALSDMKMVGATMIANADDEELLKNAISEKKYMARFIDSGQLSKLNSGGWRIVGKLKAYPHIALSVDTDRQTVDCLVTDGSKSFSVGNFLCETGKE